MTRLRQRITAYVDPYVLHEAPDQYKQWLYNEMYRKMAYDLMQQLRTHRAPCIVMLTESGNGPNIYLDCDIAEVERFDLRLPYTKFPNYVCSKKKTPWYKRVWRR